MMNESSHEMLLANIGPTKDKRGVSESFAKVKFSFVKHGRSRIKEVWSTANYLSPMPSTISKSGLLGSFLGLGWWGHPTNAYWEGLFLGVPHEPWWKKISKVCIIMYICPLLLDYREIFPHITGTALPSTRCQYLHWLIHEMFDGLTACLSLATRNVWSFCLAGSFNNSTRKMGRGIPW